MIWVKPNNIYSIRIEPPVLSRFGNTLYGVYVSANDKEEALEYARTHIMKAENLTAENKELAINSLVFDEHWNLDRAFFNY